MASWRKPDGLCDKLNVKGLVTDGGESCTFGGVLRGHNGRWIIGCGGKVPVRCQGDDEAEFIAAKHCLRTVWNVGFHYVELEVESPSAVRTMKRPQVGLMNPSLEWAKHAMSWSWDQLDISSVETPANGLAFELASHCRRVRSKEGVIIFDVPPSALMGTYEEEYDPSSGDEEEDDGDDGHGSN